MIRPRLALRQRVFRVRGRSMLPTLAPGDILVLRSPGDALPDVGQLVVIHDPQHETRRLVKRVASHGRRTLSVRSDNPLEGRDSRHFGSLGSDQVVGVVRFVVPLGRCRA